MTTLTINTKNVCKFQNVDQAKQFVSFYFSQNNQNFSDMVYISNGDKKIQAIVGYSAQNIAYVAA